MELSDNDSCPSPIVEPQDLLGISLKATTATKTPLHQIMPDFMFLWGMIRIHSLKLPAG